MPLSLVIVLVVEAQCVEPPGTGTHAGTNAF